MKNEVKLKSGANIGCNAAEFDKEFLENCFVDLPYLDHLMDMKKTRSLLLARTGAGKSALLLEIAKTQEDTSILDPKDACFQYLSSSNIIQSLISLDVDLHVFFEYLWKHVLCIHIIEHCLKVQNMNSLDHLLLQLQTLVGKEPKAQVALEYLNKWKDRFFIDTDEVSKQLIEEISSKIAAKLEVGITQVSTELEAMETAKTSSIKQLRKKVQPIVDNVQLKELTLTINVVADLINSKDKNYFILIDDLDQSFASNEIQFPLIRSLIESLKKFGQMERLKIIVALREDIYEGIKKANPNRTFQADKDEGLIVRIRWTEAQLKELIIKRINHMYSYKYTSKNVNLSDLFIQKINRQEFSKFIISNTLRRPRDVIAFINKILEKNINAKLPISQKNITSIERDYSKARMDALFDEWRSQHPYLEHYLHILAAGNREFSVSDICEEALLDLAAKFEETKLEPFDEVYKSGLKAFANSKEYKLNAYTKELLACLYKVGVLGVKLNVGDSYIYSFIDETVISADCLNVASKFKVTDMFCQGLNINNKLKKAA